MPFISIHRRVVMVRFAFALTVVALLLTSNLSGGAAQSCTDCRVYAVAELNLRQEPWLDAAAFRFIPGGAPVTGELERR